MNWPRWWEWLAPLVPLYLVYFLMDGMRSAVAFFAGAATMGLTITWFIGRGYIR